MAPDHLEFQLVAEEADFTPLFGLVPQLAALGIGARGSLELRAGGTLDRPTVRASSTSLDLTAAGVLYRLNSGELELEGDRLRLAGDLEGIDRLTGDLSFSGTGVLTLDPLLLEQLEVALTGEVTAPVLGSVEALEGRIIGAAGQGLRVEAAGLLGNPIRIEGSLSPLDLRLHGLDLELRRTRFPGRLEPGRPRPPHRLRPGPSDSQARSPHRRPDSASAAGRPGRAGGNPTRPGRGSCSTTSGS